MNCNVCKDITLVHCVTFNDGETSPFTFKPECPECTTVYDVDNIMNESGNVASPPWDLPSTATESDSAEHNWILGN